MVEKRDLIRLAVILLLVLGLYLPTPIFAETVILKSGKKIEGKIIEKTDKYIKIDFSGVPLTYYFEDIESIQERTDQLPLDYTNKGSIYVNREIGIKIKCPQGWHMTSEDELLSLPGLISVKEVIDKNEPNKKIKKYRGLIVEFSKFPFNTEDKFNPKIMVGAQDLKYSPHIKSALDSSKESLLTYRIIFPDYQLIEEPREIELKDTKGAKQIIEYSKEKGGSIIKIRLVGYTFIKDDVIISISFEDTLDDFINDIKIFEDTLNSLILD